MKVLIITPAPEGSGTGNWVTAERWANHLRALDHEVDIARHFRGQSCDLLVALHARRSAQAIKEFRAAHPALPIVVVLTGTDLYSDLPDDLQARTSVELATLLVVLNPLGGQRLEPHLRNRVRVVVQSVDVAELEAIKDTEAATGDFQVCVVGHLRPVKDPFLTAEAASGLDSTSAIRVVHLGNALTEPDRLEAERLERELPRYRWRGLVGRDEVLRVMASSRVHVLTSKMEGGANALCEAIAVGTPTLSTRIDGSVGILGDDYPGFFPVGDAPALRELLHRVETDPAFCEALKQHCVALQPMVTPATERATIAAIMKELRQS